MIVSPEEKTESRWYLDPFGLARCRATGQLRAVAERIDRERQDPDQAAAELIERQAARIAADELAYQERVAESKAGLPAGRYRDPTGLVRYESNGKAAVTHDREQHELAEAEVFRAAEHHAFLLANGVIDEDDGE